MSPNAAQIGLHFSPDAIRMACWRQSCWHFQRFADFSDVIRVVAEEFTLRSTERPTGDCTINLAFDRVTPDLSLWPSAWRGALRVAQEDFRGVVGVRVLERLGRSIPQIKHPPIDIWQVANGRQRDVYLPPALPDPDDLFAPAGDGWESQPGPRDILRPVPDWEFAAATALVLAPWVVLLDQKLPQAVHFTAEDLRSTPLEPRFTLDECLSPPTAKRSDPRLDLLQAAWTTLFDLSQECLNLDGYDLDNSVATRMLIDTTCEPIRGFTVERAGSLSGLVAELAGWIEELDGELSCDVAGLRVQTVNLDPPRPPIRALSEPI